MYYTAPSVAPQNVRIIRPSATLMVVSWRPLTLAEAMGFVSHYTVTYSPQVISGRRKRQAAMTEVVSGMDSNIVSIDGLDTDTVYNIHVSATTGGGDGVFGVISSVEAFQGLCHVYKITSQYLCEFHSLFSYSINRKCLAPSPHLCNLELDPVRKRAQL